MFNKKQERPARDGDAVVVPAGTAPLKLYTLYSPSNHPDGTVQKTKGEAAAAEALEHRQDRLAVRVHTPLAAFTEE
jgi:hypothetical protein